MHPKIKPKDIGTDSFPSHNHHLLPNISAGKQPNQSSRGALKPFNNIFNVTNLPLFDQRHYHFHILWIHVIVMTHNEPLQAQTFCYYMNQVAYPVPLFVVL
ncbi:hypothetical protein Hanom_Chr01g00064941 [Helianthus anomalus]